MQSVPITTGEVVYGVHRNFQQYFSYIVVVSFIGGGNWKIRRKPPTCRKSLTNVITKCCIEFTSPVVMGTDCIGKF
jgi:hypothetical protein